MTSRRGSGSRSAGAGSSSRSGPSQRGLAQSRSVARVASPEDDDGSLPDDDQEQDNSYTGDAVPDKKGLASDVTILKKGH